MSSSIVTRLKALHDWALEKPYLGDLVRAGGSGLKQQDKDSAASTEEEEGSREEGSSIILTV